MARPILLAVDDDVSVLEAVVQDLRRQFGAEYRVMRAASGQAALDTLAQLKTRQERCRSTPPHRPLATAQCCNLRLHGARKRACFKTRQATSGQGNQKRIYSTVVMSIATCRSRQPSMAAPQVIQSRVGMRPSNAT